MRILISVENDQAQTYTNGTKDERFSKVFGREKNFIVRFLTKQLATHMVRNDYEELCYVFPFFMTRNIITLIILITASTGIFRRKRRLPNKKTGANS